jgi:SepF-like predicted cell division protein (DUF552 family)
MAIRPRNSMLRRSHGDDTLEEGTFLDLGQMGFEDEAQGAAKGVVRMAEILRFEDLHHVTRMAYQGDVLLIDYTSIANDPVAVKRMGLDLKNVVKDTGGDVAGIAKNLLCLTPAGFRIDRQKVRPDLAR